MIVPVVSFFCYYSRENLANYNFSLMTKMVEN